MFCAGFSSASGVAFFLQNYELYRFMYIPVVFIALSQFPAFYVYIYTLTSEKKTGWKIYMHYIFPLLALILAIIINGFWLTEQEMIDFVAKHLSGNKQENFKLDIAYTIDRCYKASFNIYAIFYFILINRRILIHRKNMVNVFSNTEDISLNWIFVFDILLFLCMVSGMYFHSQERTHFVLYPERLVIVWMFTTIFYWYIGHKGYNQKQIYQNVVVKPIKQYSSQFKENEFISVLDAIMSEEKLYLESDLTLPKLAQYTGTNRSYLSKFINDNYNQNFKQFVNSYRIREAEELLSDMETNESIISISSICGFNSYDTFNRCFKDKNGISPSEYQKETAKSKV
jgi:AraC-like DNA-binding protein